MNLDDFIVRSLEGGGDPGVAADAASDPERAALADELARTRSLLADERTWAEPPAALEDVVLAAIVAEAADGPAAPVVAPTTASGSGRHRRAARSRWWSVVPAAAVAALVVGVAVSGGSSDQGDQVEVALAGTQLAPEASATAELQEAGPGVRIELHVDDLPPAEPGTYYQAWLVGPRGSVALGTFHLRADPSADVVLWSGVDVPARVVITITVEDDDGDPAPSTRKVLEGAVGDGPAPADGSDEEPAEGDASTTTSTSTPTSTPTTATTPADGPGTTAG